MQKNLLILLLMVAAHAATAQNVLLVKNKESGKQYKFSANSSVTFQLHNIPKQYVDWNVERTTDTSLILSTYSYCRDTVSYNYSERQLREIPYSDFQHYKFQESGGAKLGTFWGMLIGGFLFACSPLAAWDSEKKEWTPETCYTMAAVGGAMFSTSFIIFKKLSRKEQYFDSRKWEMHQLN